MLRSHGPGCPEPTVFGHALLVSRESEALRSSSMSGDVAVRELRNHTADMLRRVEAAERLRVTVDRRPVAELAPLPTLNGRVPWERVLSALAQGDAALRDELAEALPDTVDEL
jgi:antitoxin (DNA-binding transcriptional repressor) of toxin-antitoxin stability system